LITSLISAAIAGCNFQLSSEDDENSDGDNSSGSDGGASIGVFTNASALEVNLDSDFNLSNGATVLLDGEEVDSSELKDGMVGKIVLKETVPDDMSTGTATSVVVDHLLVGPVTQLAPLQVMNNEVTVIKETELEGINNDDIDNLSLGEIVRVSGFSNRLGGIIATRVDVPTGGAGYWQLVGNVENLVANDSFLINDQTISLNGVVAECTGALAEGDYVIVKATPIAGFAVGDPIDSTHSVTCSSTQLPALSNSDTDINELPAEMEGIVMEAANRVEFLLDDQEVEIASIVQFSGGEESDLLVGARVEVEGTVDLASGVLTANTIRFPLRPIEIEAPLLSTDVTIDESVTMLGLNITTNKMVVDDDLIVSSGVADQQVRLNGFVDEDQTPFAISLSTRGNVDDKDITLKGPVSFVSTTNFDIMGISVSGDSAEQAVGNLAEEVVVRVENAEASGSDGIKDGDITVLN